MVILRIAGTQPTNRRASIQRCILYIAAAQLETLFRMQSAHRADLSQPKLMRGTAEPAEKSKSSFTLPQV
jgi:hypothetical protein